MQEEEKEQFERHKGKAKNLFEARRSIHCPYFQSAVMLNSDGFHHLQFSARRERNKAEQLLKFRLLPVALDVIRRSGTIQEYRKETIAVGKAHSRDGLKRVKNVEYWGLIAIVGSRPIRVRVILRRVGDGNITFWSVMPHSKIKNGKQRLSASDIADDE